MTVTSGVVNCLQVGDDFAFVGITETATGTNEILILWFGPVEPSAFTRVRHSMWLSMLREAMTTGDEAHLAHDDSGALVTAVRVDRTT